MSFLWERRGGGFFSSFPLVIQGTFCDEGPQICRHEKNCYYYLARFRFHILYNNTQLKLQFRCCPLLVPGKKAAYLIFSSHKSSAQYFLNSSTRPRLLLRYSPYLLLCNNVPPPPSMHMVLGQICREERPLSLPYTEYNQSPILNGGCRPSSPPFPFFPFPFPPPPSTVSLYGALSLPFLFPIYCLPTDASTHEHMGNRRQKYF